MYSKQTTPLIIAALIIGLAGSIYLYTDTQAELASALISTQQLQTQLSQLNTDYAQLSSQIATLNNINSELETRVSELETEINHTDDTPVVVVEKNELVLDITGKGTVRNVILLIGDGMGVGQLSAAEFENGGDMLAISGIPSRWSPRLVRAPL